MSWDPNGRTGNGSAGELNGAANAWSPAPHHQQAPSPNAQFSTHLSQQQPGMEHQQSPAVPQHAFHSGQVGAGVQTQSPQHHAHGGAQYRAQDMWQGDGANFRSSEPHNGAAAAAAGAGGGAGVVQHAASGSVESVAGGVFRQPVAVVSQSQQHHLSASAPVMVAVPSPQASYNTGVYMPSPQQMVQVPMQQVQLPAQHIQMPAQMQYGQPHPSSPYVPSQQQVLFHAPQQQWPQQQQQQQQRHSPQQHGHGAGRPAPYHAAGFAMGQSPEVAGQEQDVKYGQNYAGHFGGRGGGRAGERSGGRGASGGGGAVRGEKKRERGEEPESRGRVKEKGNSKGGVKASRREVEGMPPPARVTPRAGDTTPYGDDGVPYAEGSQARWKKKNRTDKVNKGGYPGSSTGTARPPAAVTGVDRSAGQGHWSTLLTTDSIAPIELNTGARSGQVQEARGPVMFQEALVPTPMMTSPSGSGEMVIDPVAYMRMHPGGAYINLKGMDLKGKSAVSAAFELCVAMEPKARPKFEFKDNVKTNIAPFTLAVVVHGVKYTEATAKSVKLAKQLASVNFLREAVGTRRTLNLEALATEGGGGAAANAALAAAVGKGKDKSKDTGNKEKANKSKGKKKGKADGSDVSVSGGGTDSETPDEADVARLAVADGLPNYAQLLHDLVAAHPETPTYASYTFETLKEHTSKKASKDKAPGFRCCAKLLRHVVDVEETALRTKVEEDAKVAADEAQAASEANPDDEVLADDAKKAADHLEDSRAIPKLNIIVLTASGDGLSKRDAKHKAAENMTYVLLPECKTDTEMRARAKAIMHKYQTEKKARMEQEQKVAQEAKALRKAAEAAAIVARNVGEGEGASEASAKAVKAAKAAAKAAVAAAQAYEPKKETRQQRTTRLALAAAGRAQAMKIVSDAEVAAAEASVTAAKKSAGVVEKESGNGEAARKDGASGDDASPAEGGDVSGGGDDAAVATAKAATAKAATAKAAAAIVVPVASGTPASDQATPTTPSSPAATADPVTPGSVAAPADAATTGAAAAAAATSEASAAKPASPASPGSGRASRATRSTRATRAKATRSPPAGEPAEGPGAEES